ncbi:MAG: SDR family oxidoreductase, partial [Euryarchaeota archaeon]|nr:SDR family oxidoreductase [Euryarchaeota archaeon]
ARALGGLDILVNNAGMILRSGSIEGTPEAAWDRVLGVNLKGPYLCTRAALPHLRRAPRADVLFVSSIAGLAPVSLSFHYGVAKAGLLSMTRYLAHQLGPRVRVNCIVPGFVDTDWHQEATPERRRRIVERTPLGRWGRPGDIAEVALYLLSREGDFVNGQSVVVDGGVTYTWD